MHFTFPAFCSWHSLILSNPAPLLHNVPFLGHNLICFHLETIYSKHYIVQTQSSWSSAHTAHCSSLSLFSLPNILWALWVSQGLQAPLPLPPIIILCHWFQSLDIIIPSSSDPLFFLPPDFIIHTYLLYPNSFSPHFFYLNIQSLLPVLLNLLPPTPYGVRFPSVWYSPPHILGSFWLYNTHVSILLLCLWPYALLVPNPYGIELPWGWAGNQAV